MLERFGEIIGALTQLVQQSRVLDGDNRLASEILNKGDLFVSKRTNLLAVQRERTEYLIVFQYRDEQHRPYTTLFDGGNGWRTTAAVGILCREIGDVNYRFGRHHATEYVIRSGTDKR